MIPLFDTHQHLVYPDHFGYAWTQDIPALKARAFTIEDYDALTKDRGVVATLFMEVDVDPGQYPDETRFVADLAASNPRLRGIIAACRPEELDGFDAWLDTCEQWPVVAYRRILHTMADDLSQSDTFRENVQKIGARGKVFDICARADQLPIALELVRACPDVSFVLDHCGVPDIVGGEIDDWRRGISALAQQPQVTCKLSGILAYCGEDQDRAQAIGPYVEHVLQTFGPARMLWGSDWPVVNLGGGLPDWLDVTRAILDNLSPDEAAAIAHETAQRVYGVSLAP